MVQKSFNNQTLKKILSIKIVMSVLVRLSGSEQTNRPVEYMLIH